ncbi:FadR/GntR family transcriptional regulator [Desmospora activa]|uniref:GntR family transcriptional repressor for pyruvate dehydrogenase complex n=1 Tax=Desmospora activa DSM 45169 TaxID=1121389 RepID=A0A2T4Z6Q9_9BACL|nr:FadR/GntR family transcriptional regulator [Desmospora activa]PTM57560.1 GntR family transcriptional repressor for pyruvate dehydrogenase complex [Desmospora activa DSM 45169]
MGSIIERKKVSVQVLERIKEMIKSGELPPNSKLPSEMELAERFGVSRSPIREALSVLAASGIIESKQGGGSWVKEVQLVNMLEQVTLDLVDVEQVYDLLEMRNIMETEAAALAALRHDPDEIVALRQALDDFAQTVKNRDLVGDEADYRFHRIIIQASRNPFLEQTMENVSDLLKKALTFSLQKNIGLQRKREEVYQEHLAIYQAIKVKNPEKARKAMNIHLHNARRKLGDHRVTP